MVRGACDGTAPSPLQDPTRPSDNCSVPCRAATTHFADSDAPPAHPGRRSTSLSTLSTGQSPGQSTGRPVTAALARIALSCAAVVTGTGAALIGGGALSAPAASATVVTPSHPYAGGGIIPFGDAPSFGAPTSTLASAITGMAATPDGKGYWLVAADGGVFAYGDAVFAGSLGALRLTGPVVAMAPTPDGKGYWLVALDGGVFAFGDAAFYGSMGAAHLNEPIVGMSPTPDGEGYWLVASDGGIFSFGDAPFFGSTGGKPIPAGITGMDRTPDGKGYWLAGNDGSVYTFGDAPNYGGSAATKPLVPVASIVATADGKGYWLLEPDDWDYSFSDAPPYSIPPGSSITALASSQVGPDVDNARGAWCNPYGPCEAWCALFLTWVWQQAGVHVPSFPFTGSLYSWAARNGRLLPGAALPAPGDALLFGTAPRTVATSVHTGVVVEVWPDGAVITVEGDAGPAVDGSLAVVMNGPFLLSDSATYNGFPVYEIAQPTA